VRSVSWSSWTALLATVTAPGGFDVAIMNIRFISSLTPEDEERIAPGVINALGLLLDQLPLAYTLRIETSGGKVFQHAHTGHDAVASESDHLATRPLGSFLRSRAPVA
jgi:hypothetical protein